MRVAYVDDDEAQFTAEATRSPKESPPSPRSWYTPRKSPSWCGSPMSSTCRPIQGDDVSGSLDALVDLIAQLQDNLAVPSHILLDPRGWAELRKLKTGNTFNSSLLGAGTTDAVPML